MRGTMYWGMRGARWIGLGLLLLAMYGPVFASQGPHDAGYGRSFVSSLNDSGGPRVYDDPLASPQAEPSGIERIGGLRGLNKGTNYVDADVAVFDSGIDPNHPDLNVVGGVDCTGSESGWADDLGHGTHVAGTIGAIDNGYGVVGVAPGARLWSVRVIDSGGYSEAAWIECGLRWLRDHADTIDVVNASMRFTDCHPYPGWDNMGQTIPFYEEGGYQECQAAIERERVLLDQVVEAGVVVVVAAGNDGELIRLYPALDPGVISVGVYADYDGQPGGWGLPPADGCADDSYEYIDGDWEFTKTPDDGTPGWGNTGYDVLAPGVCVLSTVPGGYAAYSGTSMASPHVAGEAALLLSQSPGMAPLLVEIAIKFSAQECIDDGRVVDVPSALAYTDASDATYPCVSGTLTTEP